MENITISLDKHYNKFVKSQLILGKYQNASEVLSAGLKLLEDHEQKILALKNAIQIGLDSPRV